MRQRGMSTVGAVLLAAVAGVGAAVALADWVVVDVTTTGEDAVHLVVPFPLILGHMATAAIPDDALEDTRIPPEVAAHRDEIITALRTLVDAGDATLVEVHDGDTNVTISIRGDELLLLVDEDDAKVTCKVPLAGIADALEDWDWQTFDPGMVFDALGDATSGDLLLVEADDARVSIRKL